MLLEMHSLGPLPTSATQEAASSSACTAPLLHSGATVPSMGRAGEGMERLKLLPRVNSWYQVTLPARRC